MYSGVNNFSFPVVLTIPIVVTIMGIIFLFIDATILYVIYKILGGTGNYEGTVKIISYKNALLVLYWIPFSFAYSNSFPEMISHYGVISLFGVIIQIYGLYLCIVRGKFVHNVGIIKLIIATFLGLYLQTQLAFYFPEYLVGLFQNRLQSL